MSEWLKEHAWKACVGETLPWVRIPLSPLFRLFTSVDVRFRLWSFMDTGLVASAVLSAIAVCLRELFRSDLTAGHGGCEYRSRRHRDVHEHGRLILPVLSRSQPRSVY